MMETPAQTEDSCHNECAETLEESIWPNAAPLGDQAEFNQMDDHAEIVSVDNGGSVRLSSAERAAHGFNHRPDIIARVVWVNPDAATAPEPELD